MLGSTSGMKHSFCIGNQMKTCTKCLVSKPVDEFYKSKRVCKICIKDRLRAMYAENPDQKREKCRNAYDPEKARAYRNRLDVRKRRSESLKNWRKLHRDRVRLHHRVQMTRRRTNMNGSHTTAEWETLLRNYSNSCASCKKHQSLLPTTIEHDHKNPVVNGGSDYIHNIQPLCRHCNAKKGDMVIPQYVEQDKEGCTRIFVNSISKAIAGCR